MLNFLKLLFLIFSLCIIPVSGFAAAEYISAFNSYIIVHKDASIDVTEDINVHTAHQKIIHGLVRFLPTHYVDSYGIHHDTHYHIIEIWQAGAASRYHINKNNQQLNLYIGDKNIELPPGDYIYHIKYHVDNAINFLKDGDELYWNITGNGWQFPLNEVHAIVELPAEAKIVGYRGYTGPFGAKGESYEVEKIADNKLSFTTTKPLKPGEGFTFAIAWQKGVVTEGLNNNDWTKTSNLINLILTIIIFVYFCVVWYRHGKDPQKSTIFPIFEPPLKLSPGALRFILNMGYDKAILSATLVSLAVKGYIKMYSNGELRLEKVKDIEMSLAIEEKRTLQKIFSSDDMITINKDARQLLLDTNKTLKQTLNKNYKQGNFITNRKYFIPAAIMSLLVYANAIITADDMGTAFFSALAFVAWTYACYFILLGSLQWIKKVYHYFTFGNLIRSLFSLITVILFLFGDVIFIAGLFSSVTFLNAFLMIFIFFLDEIFLYLLKAPTIAGRKLMDAIEGFRMYLGTTERYRLDSLNYPKMTPEVFEQYLAYAVALEVENEWGQQFQASVSAAQEARAYNPAWYNGGSFNPGRLDSFPGAINDGISNALTSVTVIGSASGGSGGSGGGGGGGGGGGW